MELFQEAVLLIRAFGIRVVDIQDFLELLIRFLFNAIVAVIIVRGIYYPLARRKDYVFTYLLFSAIVFFLCHLLNNVKLSLGFALGLFAIFGIIRYRTDAIPIKEMTYLFVIIGISVINALANKKVSYVELLFTNFAIVFATYWLEKVWLLKYESSKVVTYEKIELIKPEKRALLIKDLRERTGLNIHRVRVGRIDFLRDTANIRIFFYESEESLSSFDDEITDTNQ